MEDLRVVVTYAEELLKATSNSAGEQVAPQSVLYPGTEITLLQD